MYWIKKFTLDIYVCILQSFVSPKLIRIFQPWDFATICLAQSTLKDRLATQNKYTFYIKVFAFKVTLDYEIFYKIKIFVLFYHFALSSHLKPLFFTFVLNVGF